MNRRILFAARMLLAVFAAILLAQVSPGPVLASPAGTSYGAYLDLPLPTEAGGDPLFEGHFNPDIPFNGRPTILPYDTDFGRDLWITESYLMDPVDRNETATFLIFGGDGSEIPPPAGSHTSLAVNPLDTGEVTYLGLWNLYWEGSTAGISPDNISPMLSASFDGGSTFSTLSQDDWVMTFLDGDGTIASPLAIQFEINSAALADPAATDLQLDLNVRPVPIPSAIFLLTSGLIGLLGFRKLRSR
jgi:hypothetical protein